MYLGMSSHEHELGSIDKEQPCNEPASCLEEIGEGRKNLLVTMKNANQYCT